MNRQIGRRLAGIVLAGLASVVAEAQDQEKAVTRLCEDSLADSGYEKYHYRDLVFVRQQGHYRLTGKLHHHQRKYRFSCRVSPQLGIEDLLVQPVSTDHPAPAGGK